MAKRKIRKSKITEACAAESKLDRGTLQTRSRLTPDPLLSGTLEQHRAAAGLHIREALEDGLGAQALDLVRIGLSGGASSSGRHEPLPFQRNIVNRTWLSRWRLEAEQRGFRTVFAEQFASGFSIRQIAKHHVLSRHRVTDLVNDGLDLYADMRGLRPQKHPRISVWENNNFVAPETDQPVYAAPPKAALRHRNFA